MKKKDLPQASYTLPKDPEAETYPPNWMSVENERRVVKEFLP